MALGHAVLAALLEGEASGYELSKRFDVTVANFWSTTPQQLYRELDRLSAAGLVDAHVVEQQRRPNKRVFTITDAGRDELFAFTGRPARPPAIRDEMLVKLQALEAGDLRGVMSALAERQQQTAAKLELYDGLYHRLLGDRSEAEYLRDGEQIGPYLTLMRGRMFEQQNLRWLTTAQEILSELSPSPHQTSGRGAP
jgi:DNA-binding PadR family transcriptional regulator